MDEARVVGWNIEVVGLLGVERPTYVGERGELHVTGGVGRNVEVISIFVVKHPEHGSMDGSTCSNG